MASAMKLVIKSGLWGLLIGTISGACLCVAVYQGQPPEDIGLAKAVLLTIAFFAPVGLGIGVIAGIGICLLRKSLPVRPKVEKSTQN
jgi:hypothetical protein